MLKRAEPPICVGLYARWGAGKTFMISLLKREFDPDVREDPRTRRLLQFFEEGFKEEASDKVDTVLSFACGLLLTILRSFVPTTVPYGVATFFSVICDAYGEKRSCGKLKAKVSDNSWQPEKIESPWKCDWRSWRNLTIAGLYGRLSQGEEPKYKEQKEEQKKQKEFIFVDFNAWECSACV